MNVHDVWKAAEIWGAAHPIAVAVLIFIASIFFGAVPASFTAYNVGFYEGNSMSDSNWRQSFHNKVRSAVDEEISTRCGQITQQLNMNCQKKIGAINARISEKIGEVEALESEVKQIRNRSDVLETYDVLEGSGGSILRELLSAREERNSDKEAEGRARFFTLLRAIHRMNKIYNDWSGLFDSRATELADRLANKDNISIDEIIPYLQEFTSDGEMKKKVIENEVNEARKISGGKY